MNELDDVKKREEYAQELWEKSGAFMAPAHPFRRPFSMFLVPPNASGPLHIGNALMIAIQDPLARYHRMKGDPTLWIPGTDHGGYETQITFEKELEQAGGVREDFAPHELHAAIQDFVTDNNKTIDSQISSLGASVDWSRRRFTLDHDGCASAEQIFDRMLDDDLIYRRSYMVHYCTSCATVLADIELKRTEEPSERYVVRFADRDNDDDVMVYVDRPEFLFTVTHLLVHPEDDVHAHLIGRVFVNPSTSADVVVVASERAFDLETRQEHIEAFMPSVVRYDYEYAIRHDMPTHDVIGWDGRFTERYSGMTPEEARALEVEALTKEGLIVARMERKADIARCKKGHIATSVIRQTWFMRLDDERISLKQRALEAITKERLTVFPQWRLKGLVEWIGKMHDWPIARQNVWGIRIPLWYEVTDPTLFTVWFRDEDGVRKYGRLDSFLAEGVTLERIRAGLERVYAEEGCTWTRSPKEGTEYLPETDTFDTWFTSGAWGSTVFGPLENIEAMEWYPSDVMVIGHDLLRLSVARKIFMSVYLSGRLPFRMVFLHRLILAQDGLKMSKSLGNVVSLESYLARYGADVTRMALVSYTSATEDFTFDESRLERYQAIALRLERLARACVVIHDANVVSSTAGAKTVHQDIDRVATDVGQSLTRYRLSEAQDRAVAYLETLEEYATDMLGREDIEAAARDFFECFHGYLHVLHPFMPHLTEHYYGQLTKHGRPLALASWPALASRGVRKR
jgi:valyl-tRNA synthetase